MKVTELPYNKFLGIKDSSSNEYLLELEESQNYLNHLGNVHAGALMSIAEAASGEYLLRQFDGAADKLIPVVRRIEIKFKKPLNGRVFAKAVVEPEILNKFKTELEQRKRSLVPVTVYLEDSEKNIAVAASVEWYVQYIANTTTE